MSSYDKDKLTKTMRDVENAGRALSAELSKLNTFYKDIRNNDAFPAAKKYTDNDIVSFIYQHDVFEGACSEIFHLIEEVIDIASSANESLERYFGPVDEPKIEVKLLGEQVDESGNVMRDGHIKKGDTIMDFYILTSSDPNAQKNGEGLVISLCIIDLKTRDLLTFHRPGTFELSSKNDDLMEGFVKLLRMYD
jgi:hypothetical protein